jgi:hypothetical protein
MRPPLARAPAPPSLLITSCLRMLGPQKSLARHRASSVPPQYHRCGHVVATARPVWPHRQHSCPSGFHAAAPAPGSTRRAHGRCAAARAHERQRRHLRFRPQSRVYLLSMLYCMCEPLLCHSLCRCMIRLCAQPAQLCAWSVYAQNRFAWRKLLGHTC